MTTTFIKSTYLIQSCIKKIALSVKDFIFYQHPLLETEEEKRRARTLNCIALTGIFLGLFMLPFNLLNGNNANALFDAILMLVLTYILYSLRNRGNLSIASRLIAFSFWLFLVMIFTHEERLHSGTVLWYFSYPSVAIYLTSNKEGNLWTLLTFFSGLFILIFNYGHEPNIIQFCFRYTCTFVLVTFVVNAFESMRIRTQNNWILSNQQKEQMQEKAFQSSKLATLGEMASGIAHEINNPLAVITISAQRIKKFYEKENKESVEEITKYIDKILFTSGRIDKIIKSMKSFSRNSENDRFDIVPIEKIIDETLFLCQEKIKYNDIDIVFNRQQFEKNDQLCVECKESQVSQVIMNLISNSVDAISSENQNTIGKKWIEISVSENNEQDYIEVSVTDSGTGIPKEIHSKIFNPFFTTKEVGKGTGLGLSISKNIISHHNGFLYLDTESKFTKFICLLPKKHKDTIYTTLKINNSEDRNYLKENWL